MRSDVRSRNVLALRSTSRPSFPCMPLWIGSVLALLLSFIVLFFLHMSGGIAQRIAHRASALVRSAVDRQRPGVAALHATRELEILAGTETNGSPFTAFFAPLPEKAVKDGAASAAIDFRRGAPTATDFQHFGVVLARDVVPSVDLDLDLAAVVDLAAQLLVQDGTLLLLVDSGAAMDEAFEQKLRAAATSAHLVVLETHPDDGTAVLAKKSAFSGEGAREMTALMDELAGEADFARFEEAFARRIAAAGIPGGILDVGCGPGHRTAAMRRAAPEAGPFLGIDPSRDAIAAAEERNPDGVFHAVPAETLLDVIPGGSLGGISSSLVVHHLADVPAFLAAAFAALRPGGLLHIVELDGQEQPDFRFRELMKKKHGHGHEHGHGHGHHGHGHHGHGHHGHGKDGEAVLGHPGELNFLDAPTLVKAIETAGFQVEGETTFAFDKVLGLKIFVVTAVKG